MVSEKYQKWQKNFFINCVGSVPDLDQVRNASPGQKKNNPTNSVVNS